MPSPGCPAKKRNSIWALLTRNHSESKAQDGATKPCLNLNSADRKQENSSENMSIKRQKNDVTTEIEKTFHQQRRKLSLSAPNLALVNFPDSEKAKNFAKTSTLSGDLEGPVSEKVKLSRTFSESKKEQKVRPKSAMPSEETKNLKETWPRRIKRTTMEWASNVSLTNEKKESQTTNRVRFGTIAKKVQDRKTKEEQKQMKQRRRYKSTAHYTGNTGATRNSNWGRGGKQRKISRVLSPQKFFTLYFSSVQKTLKNDKLGGA